MSNIEITRNSDLVELGIDEFADAPKPKKEKKTKKAE